MANEFKEPYLLLVEGNNDTEFFGAFIKKLKLTKIEIKKYGEGSKKHYEVGGKSQLKPYLTYLFQEEDFQKNIISLGIIRDADSSKEGTTAAIKSIYGALESALKEVNIGLPKFKTKNWKKLPSQPLIIPLESNSDDVNLEQVVLMVMPDKETCGVLEDLCLKAVASDPAISCINEYFKCLKSKNTYPLDNCLSKAKVQAFLASRKEVDYYRLGMAIEKNYLPFDHEAFKEVREFLQAIVSLKE